MSTNLPMFQSLFSFFASCHFDWISHLQRKGIKDLWLLVPWVTFVQAMIIPMIRLTAMCNTVTSCPDQRLSRQRWIFGPGVILSLLLSISKFSRDDVTSHGRGLLFLVKGGYELSQNQKLWALLKWKILFNLTPYANGLTSWVYGMGQEYFHYDKEDFVFEKGMVVEALLFENLIMF